MTAPRVSWPPDQGGADMGVRILLQALKEFLAQALVVPVKPSNTVSSSRQEEMAGRGPAGRPDISSGVRAGTRTTSPEADQTKKGATRHWRCN